MMAGRRTTRWRHQWVAVHRWLGLVAGLLFCVMGLTGSILVYYQEIDQWLNPTLVVPQDTGKAQPMEAVLRAASARANGRFVHSVYPAGVDYPVHHVWLTPSASDQSRMWEMLVDPATARVLGERQAVPVFEPDRRNLMNTIYTLHYNLFAGAAGATVVGLIGMVLLGSAISGLVLWWPRGARWRQALTLKRGARGHRLHVDLHRLAGSYGAVLLILAAFTGVCLVFPDQVAALFPKEQELPTSSATATPTIAQRRGAVDADGAVAAAREAVPGARATLLWLPGAAGSTWRVTLREPTGLLLAGHRADIDLDPATGAITRRMSYEDGSAADKFLAWQLPLHNGTALGWVGRLAICIAGLLPTMLMVTGVLIYVRKRRARLTKRADVPRKPPISIKEQIG